MDFIPAQESTLFIALFKRYVKVLFKRRFKHIWIHQDYQPSPNSRTVYFLNHTSWWDGLIPFLLNEYRFKQRARAMMEYKQMKKYTFFKKIGVFSIKPDDRAHTLRTLRYALQSMRREHASLFIYPEGKIRPATSPLHFQSGLGWLYTQLSGVDFVPIGIHIHTIRHNKPELHLWVDEPLKADLAWPRQELTDLFEKKMKTLLKKVHQTAGFDDSLYGDF